MANNLISSTGVTISGKEQTLIIALLICGVYGVCKTAIKNGYSFHVNFDNDGRPSCISFSSPETIPLHKSDPTIDD